jgi:hypothetical protein
MRFEDGRFFVPCIRDHTRLQINALHDDVIDQATEEAGVGGLADSLRQLSNVGRMPDDEIHAELLLRTPEISEIVDIWEKSPLHNLTLTTVGIAIGHAYWRRTTKSPEPLSTWI